MNCSTLLRQERRAAKGKPGGPGFPTFRRPIAVVLVVIGALGLATAGATSATPKAQPPVGPVISRNAPAYGDGKVLYDPAWGVDDKYGSGAGAYLCRPTCSLIVDLSRVPAAKRRTVVVAWYSDASVFYPPAANASYYDVPRDYTIDVSRAPGGGKPPTSWRTVATVTGNAYNGRVQLVRLGGANWIRMRVTAVDGSPGNNAASFNLDVSTATPGLADAWLLLGDSITGDDMGHTGPGNFMQLIAAAKPARFPTEIDGGMLGWDAGSPLQVDPRTGRAYIDEFLADFPGRFVSLDFGTSDALQGGDVLASFTQNMTTLIQKVIAAGKVPVIRRSIPWGCAANLQENGPTVNADLASLLSQFPQAIAGPDDWPYFDAHQSLIGSDCVDPTPGAGVAAYRKLFVDAVLASG